MSLASLLALLLLPLLLAVAVVLWLTESPEQRINRWHSAGMSQRTIASRLGTTRYQVRLALAKI